jgi:hypothetical protein
MAVGDGAMYGPPAHEIRYLPPNVLYICDVSFNSVFKVSFTCQCV